MAVFTDISAGEVDSFLRRQDLGSLVKFETCKGGVDNSNFFAETDRGSFVLTLFERLKCEQLPYYLGLMKHLAQKGIPVPLPMFTPDTGHIPMLKSKPASVFTRLRGTSVITPSTNYCHQVGKALARMHQAARDFTVPNPNCRDLTWCQAMQPSLIPFLNQRQNTLLSGELLFQKLIQSTVSYHKLPRGPIHGDLFRDNVLFKDGQLSGILDFYFSGTDALILDVAICLNDWCVDQSHGKDDPNKINALLTGYQSERVLEVHERSLLPALRRAGALRFWISRLIDMHLPRPARDVIRHDPESFERMLRL